MYVSLRNNKTYFYANFHFTVICFITVVCRCIQYFICIMRFSLLTILIPVFKNTLKQFDNDVKAAFYLFSVLEVKVNYSIIKTTISVKRR